MKAIILAGGKGERLLPLTKEKPKPLIEVGKGPILTHIINNLHNHGVDDIILSIGHLGHMIKMVYQDGHDYGVKISYFHEKKPLGTGGAVRDIVNEFKICEPFILVWADNLANYDFVTMMKLKNGADVVMALVPRADVENFGVVELSGDSIIGFVEKPKRDEAPSTLVNAGAFLIKPEILKRLPAEGKCSIERELFELIAKEGRIRAFVHEGYWYNTDTKEALAKAKKFAKGL